MVGGAEGGEWWSLASKCQGHVAGLSSVKGEGGMVVGERERRGGGKSRRRRLGIGEEGRRGRVGGGQQRGEESRGGAHVAEVLEPHEQSRELAEW